MNAWPRLRIVCSLLLGIVAGLLMWMLPQPRPTFTLALPAPPRDEEGATFTLQAVSSDARHVITFGKHHAEKWNTINVWDRHRGLDKPLIAVPLDQEGWDSYTTLFSPDEQTLAVAVWYWPKKRHDLVWFDLRTGAKIKGVELEMLHILFAPDGKLLYVNAGGVVRDLQTGEGLRKQKLDGFEGSIGEFAICRKEEEVRLYSYLTGERRSAFTLPRRWTIVGVSRDGQIVSASSWPASGFGDVSAHYQLINAPDNTSRPITDADLHLRNFRALSSDGSLLISEGQTRTQRHPWLAKWWPDNVSEVRFYVTRWKTDEHLAEFRNVSYLCFSPRGNLLAVMRADLAIDVYDFPLHKPLAWIIGVALLTAIGAWGTGWLWSRWRATRRRTT